MKRIVPQEIDMLALGAHLADALPPSGFTVALKGDLGAGKTTLVRAVLKALGVKGHVRSPTYTLVEPYELAGRRAWHLDLYRVGDPEELEFLGIRDLDSEKDLILVEWPERGAGLLPAVDLVIEIELAEPTGREVTLIARSERGESLARAGTEVQ